MNVLITGISGLIGSSLVEHLFGAGHTIFSLQRNKADAGPFWDFSRTRHMQPAEGLDAVIHLAGENIASGRWTRSKKERILASRVAGTNELARYLASLEKKPEVMISASATGFYGNRGAQPVDESSSSGSTFLADVCRQWEQATTPAREAGIRVVHARLGVVLSGRGGLLQTMLAPLKLGRIGDGSQFISWVGIDDVVAMFVFLTKQRTIAGPVNLVTPEPTTNKELIETLGKLLGRATGIRMPALAARTVFGAMADELLLASLKVKPSVLQNNAYPFVSPDLRQTLAQCLLQRP